MAVKIDDDASDLNLVLTTLNDIVKAQKAAKKGLTSVKITADTSDLEDKIDDLDTLVKGLFSSKSSGSSPIDKIYNEVSYIRRRLFMLVSTNESKGHTMARISHIGENPAKSTQNVLSATKLTADTLTERFGPDYKKSIKNMITMIADRTLEHLGQDVATNEDYNIVKMLSAMSVGGVGSELGGKYLDLIERYAIQSETIFQSKTLGIANAGKSKRYGDMEKKGIVGLTQTTYNQNIGTKALKKHKGKLTEITLTEEDMNRFQYLLAENDLTKNKAKKTKLNLFTEEVYEKIQNMPEVKKSKKELNYSNFKFSMGTLISPQLNEMFKIKDARKTITDDDEYERYSDSKTTMHKLARWDFGLALNPESLEDIDLNDNAGDYIKSIFPNIREELSSELVKVIMENLDNYVDKGMFVNVPYGGDKSDWAKYQQDIKKSRMIGPSRFITPKTNTTLVGQEGVIGIPEEIISSDEIKEKFATHNKAVEKTNHNELITELKNLTDLINAYGIGMTKEELLEEIQEIVENG